MRSTARSVVFKDSKRISESHLYEKRERDSFISMSSLVHPFFKAEADTIRFLHAHHHRLRQHRDALTVAQNPSLDADCVRKMRETMAMIFPDQDLLTLFRQSRVQAFRADLASKKHQVSIDDLVYLQLAIIFLGRLAVDYLEAADLFEKHRDGFIRAYPRALAFNAVTSSVSWNTVEKQVAELLRESFPERYEDMEESVRDARLSNEALSIGLMMAQQSYPEVKSSDGIAYEAECEALLREAGYMVEKTPFSGDFGIDLLARKNGLTYAIQCKCYSTPVGVGAVQEAAAGCLHYVADCAVVVALSGFTAAARRLAASNSVLLIAATQLTELHVLALPLIG